MTEEKLQKAPIDNRGKEPSMFHQPPYCPRNGTMSSAG